MDFSESPTDPLGGGGWTLDLQKERNFCKTSGHAKDQIEEENRLNLAELPDDVTLLNPPKVDGA